MYVNDFTEVQCILSYPNLDYPNPHLSELTKVCYLFNFTLSIHASANARSIQKGCNGDVDTCIFRIIQLFELFTYPNNPAQPPDQRGLDNRGCTVAI